MIHVASPWTGGCDSTYLVWQLARNGYIVHTYHVDYGHLTYPAEQWAINKIYSALHSSDWNIGNVHKPVNMTYYIPHTNTMWSTGQCSNIYTKNLPHVPTTVDLISRCSWDVPFRNAILFSMGVSYAESIGVDTLMLSLESDEETLPGSEYRDNSTEFINAFNNLCSISSFVKIDCPVSDKDVAERYGFAYELNIHPYINVGRCNYPRLIGEDFHPCGKCICCESSKYILRRDYGTDEFWGTFHEDQHFY